MEQERQDYWRGQLLVYEAAQAYGDAQYDGVIETIRVALTEAQAEPISIPEPNEPVVKPEELQETTPLSQHQRNLNILADLRSKQHRVHSSEGMQREPVVPKLSPYQEAHERRKQLIKDIRSGRVEGDNTGT